MVNARALPLALLALFGANRWQGCRSMSMVLRRTQNVLAQGYGRVQVCALIGFLLGTRAARP